jgi:CubicO group peptidase (beta-lactamase class C family)
MGEPMTDATLPLINPAFAPPTSGVDWPTAEWPRGQHPKHDELDAVVDEMFTSEELAITNSVVVIQGGQVVAERYGGVREFFDRPPEPVTSETPLLSWSMAKSMLHFIIGTLVDAGELDPNEQAIVPEWSDESDLRHGIRLRDLLAMRDGLDFNEAYVLGEPSHVIEMLFGDGQQNMAAFAAARPLAHEPGTVFNYSSGTTNVLSRIVADVVGCGDAYRDYLDQRLFGPLGMTSAEPTFDDAGVFVASSYVHATALDFAKFGLLYLRGGEWDGRQLISQEWAKTAQIPLSVDAETGWYYSWQWWVTSDDYGTYWASGYEGQQISIVPALDALILRFGHTPEEKAPLLMEWRQRVIQVLASAQAPS